MRRLHLRGEAGWVAIPRVLAALEVDGLQVSRRGGPGSCLPRLVLHNGEAAALVGPSGCGKSSLLRAALGQGMGRGDRLAGRVALRGEDLLGAGPARRRQLLRSCVAFVPQDAAQAFDPLRPLGAQLAALGGCDQGAAAAALAELGIADGTGLLRRLPHEVSTGQAQRALVALALLRRPLLLVADEPTASLDDAACGLVCAALARLGANGTAMLLATHDPRLLAGLGCQQLRSDEDGCFAPSVEPKAPWPVPQPRGAASDEPILRARGLGAGFGARRILSGLDFDLLRGEVVAVLGPSGVGKTTLLRILAGRKKPDQGSVAGPNGHGRVQLLAQDAAASLTPRRSLRALVAEAAAPSFRLEPLAAALRLPREVLDRGRESMSLGQARRAALLRAMAVEPAALLLDEPTASLDRRSAAALVASLLELRDERGLAIVLATHDRELASAVADRVVELQELQA